jgi:hypothetical protein
MSSTAHETASWRRKLALAGATLAGALLLPAAAVADPKPIPPPAIPGVPGLAGPVAPAAQPVDNMGILKATPDTAPGGTAFTLAGSGLAPGKAVTIVWMTANVSYVVDARPDTVDFIGRKVDKLGVTLGKTTTDAKGAFSLSLTAPKDFGGIHDLYAVVDGKQVAKGGFLVSRVVTMTPTSGPLGTPITITVSGLGSSQYESEAAVLYDNHFTGLIAGNTTRGTATVQIRAAGPVGRHQVEVYDASHVLPYLNIEQSPLPWLLPSKFEFTVTKDAGPPSCRSTSSPRWTPGRRSRREPARARAARPLGSARRAGAFSRRSASRRPGSPPVGRSTSSGRPSSATASTAPGRAGRPSRCRWRGSRPRPTAR